MPVPVRPRVFALDPLQSEALELAQKHFDLVLPSDSDAGAWRQQAEGLLVIGSYVTEADFEQVSQEGKLKFVSKQGTGVDKIALAGAKKAGVPVMNTPGVNVSTGRQSSPRAELTQGSSGCRAGVRTGCHVRFPASSRGTRLTDRLARQISAIDRRIRKGEAVTKKIGWPGQTLQGKTIGVIGAFS